MISPLTITSLDQGRIFGANPTLDELTRRSWFGSSTLHQRNGSAENGSTERRSLWLRSISRLPYLTGMPFALVRRAQPWRRYAL